MLIYPGIVTFHHSPFTAMVWWPKKSSNRNVSVFTHTKISQDHHTTMIRAHNVTVPISWTSFPAQICCYLLVAEVTTVTPTVLFCLFSTRLREKPPVSVSIQSRKTMRTHWTVNRPKAWPSCTVMCVFSMYDPVIVESTYIAQPWPCC